MFVPRTWIFSVLVVLVLLKCISSEEDCDFKCEENGSCIRNSALCNGTAECLHGSDESYIQCKNNIPKMPNTFYCASGAQIIVNSVCNTQVDCVDKSDELLTMERCENAYEYVRHKEMCESNQIMCTPGVCISEDKRCDGTIDCFNGRDESIELCLKKCDNSFQCANGKCLNDSHVCDGKYDCIDGSDELQGVCNEKEGWEPKPIVKCTEPSENGLLFSADTKYYKPLNEARYVYPNMNVSFKCFNSRVNMTGNEMNVCMIDGSWRFNLPSCTEKFVNLNPDTNGTNGCRIDTYSKYENLLRIYKCGIDGTECTEKTTPPINDMTVRFQCDSGYTLYPIKTNSRFGCQKKDWNKTPKYEDPRCVKLCSSTMLTCRDSLKLDCYHNKNKKIKLSDPECYSPALGGHYPDTLVDIKCTNGFTDNRKSRLQLECLDDGTWRNWNETQAGSYCTLECGQQRMTGASMGAPKMDSVHSPWSVALFQWNASLASYTYKCGGVLIHHNIVLTVAHCVCEYHSRTILGTRLFRVGPSTSNETIVSRDFGWTVKQIVVNEHFAPVTFMFDSALLHLEDSENLVFPIICLPWLHNVRYTESSLTYNLGIWDTAQMINSSKLAMTFVGANARNAINGASFKIRPLNNAKICSGDSGGGLISGCSHAVKGDKRSCLFGIVSAVQNGANKTTGCSNDVTVTNTRHHANLEFIKEFYDKITNSCHLI